MDDQQAQGKFAHHHWLLEECKSKPQWDITSHLTSVRMAIVKKSVRKREPSYTVFGNVNLCSHYQKKYGDSLEN